MKRIELTRLAKRAAHDAFRHGLRGALPWLLAGAAIAGDAAPIDEPPLQRPDLAAMIQQVAVRTHISMGIRETGDTHVRIDRVNGRSVCDPAARSDVERLQLAFDAHPSIYRNIGPALMRITSRTGEKSLFDRAVAMVGGSFPACATIYVSVHDQP